MRVTPPITTIGFLFFLVIAITAQPTLTNQIAPAQEQEQIALALLEKMIAETASLTLEENRCKLWLGAAELLWERDEKRARTLLTQAFTEYATLEAAHRADGEAKKEMSEIHARLSPSVLREELVRTATKLDPSVAWDFFISTQSPPTKYDTYFNRIGDPEQLLEMAIIRQTTAKNMTFAVEKAEKHLAKYSFQDFTNEVGELAAQDKAAATTLTKAIVASFKKLTGAEAANNLPVLENLLRAALGANQLVRGAPWKPTFSIDPKAPRLGDAVLREILETMGATALERAKNDAFHLGAETLFSTPEIFQQLEKYTPVIAQQLKKQTQQNFKAATPERQSSFIKQQTNPHKEETVESLLANGKTATADQANMYYQSAARLALQQGNFQQARQIIDAHFKDTPRSVEMDFLIADLERGELDTAVKTKDVATAQQLANKQYSLHDKITALAGLATNLVQAGQAPKAAEILQELRQQLGGQITTQEQLQSQFHLAKAYAQLDPTQSFAILELTIPRLNELVAALATLQGVQLDAAFLNGEMSFRQFDSPVPQLLSKQIDALSALVKTDPQRISVLLEMYQRHEIRTWARLSICQQLLQK